jgi:membrane protease YdiL (CAAX protease family)
MRRAVVAENQSERSVDLKLFGWLVLAGLFGALIGTPWTIAVFMDPVAGGPVEPLDVWLGSLAEALLFLAPAAAVGAWLGKRVGLGARLLSGLVARAPGTWNRLRSSVVLSVGIGVVLGLVALWSRSQAPPGALGPGLDNPTAVQWLLRSLSAGITEEIFFRLGLMTLLVWLVRRILRRKSLEAFSVWTGNLLAALVFAAAHLPHVVTTGSVGSVVIAAIVILNVAAGVALGWLYSRYGLIPAVVAHFLTDVVQWVVPVLVTGHV